MERRTFLLGLIGSLATASLTPAMAAPSVEPHTPSEGAKAEEISADNAEIRADNLDGVDTEYAQYYRRRGRRVYRRYYRRPYRRYRRRARRYWRRGRWYY
jgi:hypothetical protein